MHFKLSGEEEIENNLIFANLTFVGFKCMVFEVGLILTLCHGYSISLIWSYQHGTHPKNKQVHKLHNNYLHFKK